MMVHRPVRGRSAVRHLFTRLRVGDPWAVAVAGIITTLLFFVVARQMAVEDFHARLEANFETRAKRAVAELQGLLTTAQVLGQFAERTNDDAGKPSEAARSFADVRSFAAPFFEARGNLGTFCWIPVASLRCPFQGGMKGRMKVISPVPRHRGPESTGPKDGEAWISRLDPGAQMAFRSSLERVGATGNASVTTLPRPTANALPQKEGEEDLVIMVPVYNRDTLPATMRERKAALQGFVLCIPRLDRIIQGFPAPKPSAGGFSSEFLDVSRGRTFYRSTMASTDAGHSWVSALLPSPRPYFYNASFAGMDLGITITPDTAFVYTYLRLFYWLTFPVGFVLTVTAVLYRKSITQRETERKKSEEALKDSERTFRDLAEKSVLGVSLVQDGIYRYVNDKYAGMHGLIREEMIGHTANLDMVHIDDRARVAERLSACRAGGPAGHEFRMVTGQGEEKTVLGYAFATTYRGTSGTIGTLLDITELKEAEKSLRENEARLSNAMNLSKIVYWEHDIARREFVFNDAFYELYGTSAEREGGYKMKEEDYFKRFIHPEDLNLVVGQSGRIARYPGDTTVLSHRVVRPDGSVLHIACTRRFVFNEKGEVEKTIGANQDITAQKEAEEALKWKTAFLEAQVNSSIDGVLVIDNEGRTILRNRRMVDMWKLPQAIVDEKDEKGQWEHSLSMAKEPKAFRDKVAYLYSHPRETMRYEVELKEGTVLDTYSCPVLGHDGAYYGRIWTFRDITELKHYWEMLENLSSTDGLTELSNRRRFDEALDKEWRRAIREGSSISLIILDIDYFKEFNDHYGHLAGDDCLRRVAGVLREVVQRPGDLVARYGGEEFACILPETDLMGAETLAETIRERIRSIHIPHAFSTVADHLTLSFGVATMFPENRQASSDLVRMADDLLYSAKHSGRDRVRGWRYGLPGKQGRAG